jgi:hypothetical protein
MPDVEKPFGHLVGVEEIVNPIAQETAAVSNLSALDAQDVFQDSQRTGPTHDRFETDDTNRRQMNQAEPKMGDKSPTSQTADDDEQNPGYYENDISGMKQSHTVSQNKPGIHGVV